MICCDTCLDWFHGKCVGISKQKGKEMEEVTILPLILILFFLLFSFPFFASLPLFSSRNLPTFRTFSLEIFHPPAPQASKDFQCPKCLENLARGAEGAAEVEDLLEGEEEEQGEEEQEEEQEEVVTPRKSVTAAARRKSSGAGASAEKRRRRSSGGEEGRKRRSSGGEEERRRRRSSGEPREEKKPRVPRCHMCASPPIAQSIYCGEACIAEHAGQVRICFKCRVQICFCSLIRFVQALKQLGSKVSAVTPVVVLEPKTNTLLNGPNAPTQVLPLINHIWISINLPKGFIS